MQSRRPCCGGKAWCTPGQQEGSGLGPGAARCRARCPCLSLASISLAPVDGGVAQLSAVAHRPPGGTGVRSRGGPAVPWSSRNSAAGALLGARPESQIWKEPPASPLPLGLWGAGGGGRPWGCPDGAAGRVSGIWTWPPRGTGSRGAKGVHHPRLHPSPVHCFLRGLWAPGTSRFTPMP